MQNITMSVIIGLIIALFAGGAIVVRPMLATSVLRVPQDYATIQAAINAAQNGDLILVSPGTYQQSLQISAKTITLASEFHTTGDESLIDATIIDGGMSIDKDSGGTKIIGFTIQNGNDGILPFAPIEARHNRIRWNTDGLDFEGGIGSIVENNIFEENSDDGLDLDRTTSAVIRQNIIRNNGSDGIEMRIHHYSGTAPLEIVIANNTIINNGDDGLQIIEDLSSSQTTNRLFVIKRNVIAYNGAAALGFLDNGDSKQDFRAAKVPDPVHFFNNTVVDNNHGISGSASDLVVVNNIFANHLVALKKVDAGSVAASNLFWNNGIDFQNSNVELPTTLFADPLLAGDFTLLPDSPAIDAGTAQYTHAGELILDIPPVDYAGAAPDLGAFESNINQPPAVNAGPDQTIIWPTNSVTLDGTVTDDGLPDPPAAVTMIWSVVSGPGTVTFDNPNGIDTTASFSIDGIYVLRLTVDDSQLMSSDEVTITVYPAGSYPFNIFLPFISHNLSFK